ncbi:MAG: LamG domain-containing protein [Opitutales bacterium]|nr:LamG domain-containing protein [Opitutales bacterium]MCH8541055.1 LamG domain-containing protein [Opitutales bacterium]
MKTFSTLSRALALSFVFSATASANLHDGLIVYFPLNEESGNIAADIHGQEAVFSSLDGQPPNWNGSDLGVLFDYDNREYFAVTDASLGNSVSTELTIAARIAPAGQFTWNTMVSKGGSTAPYLFLFSHVQSVEEEDDYRLAFFANSFTPPGGSGGGTFFSTGNFRQTGGDTFHVAVTYDGHFVRFYLNGNLDSEFASPGIVFGDTTHPLHLGANFAGETEYLAGILGDVAVYDRALSGAEIADLMNHEFVLLPTAFTGLWVGNAELSEVQEVANGEWTPAPAPFLQRVILHVDEAGVGRLLPEATLMQTRVESPAEPQNVIITVPAKLAEHDGVVRRGGHLIGQRFSTAHLPAGVAGLELGAGGTIDLPQALDQPTFGATLTLPAAHPLNPFRHKYHPDLQNGYDLVRNIRFTVPSEFLAQEHSFTGAYQEEFTGLHKDILRARGSITFTRVSTSGLLNP